jgi:CRISPR-associated protein Csa3
MLMIATLGFDEKFIIRELLRRGVDENTKVILLSSGEDQRTENAYNAIKELSKTIPFQTEFKNVNIKEPYLSISDLRKMIKSYTGDKIVFNISGGQRILIFYLLCAITSLGQKGEIVIHSEDSSFTVNLPTNIMFQMNLDDVDNAILDLISKKTKIRASELSKLLNMPQVTVWRRIKRLQELGLVDYKSREYYLTEIGQSRI